MLLNWIRLHTQVYLLLLNWIKLLARVYLVLLNWITLVIRVYYTVVRSWIENYKWNTIATRVNFVLLNWIRVLWFEFQLNWMKNDGWSGTVAVLRTVGPGAKYLDVFTQISCIFQGIFDLNEARGLGQWPFWPPLKIATDLDYNEDPQLRTFIFRS